jgi:Hormone-sensitive lipase (HSL) N-terminus
MYLSINRLFFKQVKLNETFIIETDEFEINNATNDGTFKVPTPMVHIGKKSIQMRLMSNTIRKGMVS